MTEPQKLEQLYTVKEAAKLLSISPYTIYCRIGRGLIPAVRIGKAVRIKHSTLLQLQSGQSSR